MPDNYLQIQGRILDKITGTVRKAGPRIYRVSLLPKLLELSESMKDHIRPESRLITHAGRNGWPSRYIPAVWPFTILNNITRTFTGNRLYMHENTLTFCRI